MSKLSKMINMDMGLCLIVSGEDFIVDYATGDIFKGDLILNEACNVEIFRECFRKDPLKLDDKYYVPVGTHRLRQIWLANQVELELMKL